MRIILRFSIHLLQLESSKHLYRPYKDGYTLIAQEGTSTASAHAGKYELSLYDANTFSVTWELVPGRGAFEKTQQDLIEAAQKAAASGRVHALTITDNPGGQPALWPRCWVPRCAVWASSRSST